MIKIENKSRKLPQFIASFTASIAAMITGTVLGWSSSVVPQFLHPHTVNELDYDFEMSLSRLTNVVAIIGISGAVMSIPTGVVVGLIGARRTMILLVVPITIGWTLIVFAPNSSTLLWGRFLTGISSAGYLITTTIYIGEITEREISHILISCVHIMLLFGIFISFVMGYLMNVPSMSMICSWLPLLYGCIFAFMPESPFYLISSDKTEEAIKSLKWLRGKDYDTLDEIIRLQKMIADSKAENSQMSILKTLIKRSSIKTILLTIGLCIMMQMTGFNSIIFFATDIFSISSSHQHAGIETIILGSVQLLVTICTSIFVTKCYRRTLLLISSALLTLCLLMMGMISNLMRNENMSVDDTITWLPLLLLSIYVSVYSVGCGPISWFIINDIVSSKIKYIVIPMAVSFSWFLTYCGALAFQMLRMNYGMDKPFWFYSVFSLFGFAFTLYYVPETRGKTTEEIQSMFEAN